MSGNLLLEIGLKKSQLIEKTVNSWRANENGGERDQVILGIEDAIVECLQFPAEMQRAWNSLVKKMAVTRLPYSPELLEQLRQTFDHAISASVRVFDEAQQVE